MTSTSLFSPSTTVESSRRASGMPAARRGWPAAIVGLVGAAVLVYGVTQPWISAYAGLITQSGWDTRNGNLLLAGAVVSALLAVVSAIWGSPAIRWLLALTGFATVALGGYLLIQLYTVTQTSDSLIFLDKGPGLYVATAGAAIVFSTIFLPMPAASRGAGDGAGDAANTAATVPAEIRGRSTWLLSAVSSPWRYPAALLAVVAGLAHVPVTPEHLNEAPYIGVLFIALTVACVILAAALLISDSPAVWAAIGGACLLAVVAFVLSRTIGLPLIEDDIGNWSETLAVVSVLTESGVVILLALALRASLRGSRT